MSQNNVLFVIDKPYKKITCFLFFLIAFSSLQPFASAQESSLLDGTVYVDNAPIKTEYALRDGHMMVPALFFKHTGSEVDWNQEYQSVVFRFGQTHVAVASGKEIMTVKNEISNEWKNEPLPIAPISADGHTFVPLVEVAEKLGLQVTYDTEKKQTLVQNPQPKTTHRIGSGNPDNMQVALTFDDGPDATYTPKILDILSEKGVPATFFVVGQEVGKYPEMMKRIVEEGHGLGNHTFTHPQLPKITSIEVLQEIQNTQKALAESVGKKPDLFRPPYGALTRADEELATEKGFRIVTWSVDTLDWTGLSGEEIFLNVQKDISPGGIILQHNVDANPGMLDGTVEALPKIIDDLHARGYTFVTVQTMLDGS